MSVRVGIVSRDSLQDSHRSWETLCCVAVWDLLNFSLVFVSVQKEKKNVSSLLKILLPSAMRLHTTHQRVVAPVEHLSPLIFPDLSHCGYGHGDAASGIDLLLCQSEGKCRDSFGFLLIYPKT